MKGILRFIIRTSMFLSFVRTKIDFNQKDFYFYVKAFKDINNLKKVQNVVVEVIDVDAIVIEEVVVNKVPNPG